VGTPPSDPIGHLIAAPRIPKPHALRGMRRKHRGGVSPQPRGQHQAAERPGPGGTSLLQGQSAGDIDRVGVKGNLTGFRSRRDTPSKRRRP
jgi:hypothetical protein